MPEPQERFQVGDTCYTGTEAAAGAFIARFEPVVINMDHGEGHGIEPTVFKALFYEEGFYDPHNDITIDGGIVYEATGLLSGGQTHRTLGFAQPPCLIDSESAITRADAGELTLIFLAALVAIWGAKLLMKLFGGDVERA